MGSKVIIVSVITALVLALSPFSAEAKSKKKQATYRVKYAYGFSQGNLWAQDRINQGYTTVLDGKTPIDSNFGSGIDIYVVDSGIGEEDCAGHGTIVASILADQKIGIVKQANIVSIKVLNCDGETTQSSFLNAINQIKASANPSTSVVNISLGGPKSEAIDAAVNELGAMMPVVVAAGNESIDACKTSPAGAKNAITVSSVDKYQWRTWFANFGSCVDMWAPGKNVDAVGKDGVQKQVNGTSVSAPLVAAAIAYVADRDNSTTMEAALTLFRESSDAPVINGYYSGKKPFSLWIRETPGGWIRSEYPSSLP